MGENLKEKLFLNKKNGWLTVNSGEKDNIFKFCEGYIDYLNTAKTEREAAAYARKVAEEHGFKDVNTM